MPFRILSEATMAQIKLKKQDTCYYDKSFRSFFVRSYVTGRCTFNVRLQHQNIRQSYCLGDADNMTLEQAKQAAQDWLNQHELLRKPETNSLSLHDFSSQFFTEYKRRWKPSTFKNCLSGYHQYIEPKLGHLLLQDIERKHIEQWFYGLSHRKGIANRLLPVLSVMMQHAGHHGYRSMETNPCKNFKRYPSENRPQFLNENELTKLGVYLDKHEGMYPHEVALIRLLVLTGARTNEIKSLEWSFYKEGHLYLKDSKTGAKTIFLSDAARAILNQLPQVEVFVFPELMQYPQRLKNFWSVLRQDLELPRLRLHDLRHTYASMALKHGCPLLVLSRLLGHACTETTLIYAHFQNSDIHKHANAVGQTLMESCEL